MIANGGRVSVVPPRELNVAKFIESRASELVSLHSIVADRLGNDFRSRRNKRRRTTGHDDRRSRKKRKVAGETSAKGDHEGKGEKKLSRRIRRRIELKKNPPNGFVTSGDGTKRLRTHVWHAKRFTMEKLWGFYLPLGLHGRGRGSRAILRKLKQSVLLHDMSYCGCVQLEGPEGLLITLLCSLLMPPSSASCGGFSPEVLSGAAFGNTMLHDVGKSDHPSLSPVTFMWRPLQSEISPVIGSDINEAAVRQVWLWIHASAFDEAYNALHRACKGLTSTVAPISCVSLEGQLAKLELVGSKAVALLQKTLVPAGCVDSWHLKKCSADEIQGNDLSANQTSPSSIIPMIVKDPRTLNQKDGEPLGAISTKECRIEAKPIESVHFDLWDVSKGLSCPPREENVLCLEKQNKRNEFLHLVNGSSEPRTASAYGKHSSVCPILLLINGHHGDSVSRCSVVVPLDWAKAFWNTFIRDGAHAIGLREKHWVASELQLPFFPWDFPDCSAYSDLMSKEAAALDHKASLLTASKQPPEIPIPPPWNSVRLSLDKDCSHIETTKEDKSRVASSHGSRFEGIVARTSLMIPDFPGHECVERQPNGQACCYVRVLLNAHKEGVFEEGAAICAPLVSDLKLWSKGPETEADELQQLHSSVSPFFMKLQSGEWALGLPDDPVQFELQRWPIGFVTSGFVRGSKKATAVALCEAKLLWNLRREQLRAFPARRQRKEVLVLVRNLRSTVYRRAVATIVLEHREQDLDFL